MAFADHLASADRAVLTHLGGAVVYTSVFGVETTITAIFSKPDGNTQVGDGTIATASPSLFALVADLPDDPDSDEAAEATLTCNGHEYRIRDITKDGAGGVVLTLRETGVL